MCDFTIRTDLRPGDLGWVVYLHGAVEARELGFDHTFEAYVAGPLAELVRRNSLRERIWLAEAEGRVVGCIAIVEAAEEGTAQLRWFLLSPEARGRGLGKRLLAVALAFCREAGYRRVILWTVSALTTAAHLYRAAGFRKVEEVQGQRWAVDVVEERYELMLDNG